MAEQPLSHHALIRKRALHTITSEELVQLRALDLISQRRHRAKIRGNEMEPEQIETVAPSESGELVRSYRWRTH